jgi:hypothetical protein
VKLDKNPNFQLLKIRVFIVAISSFNIDHPENIIEGYAKCSQQKQRCKSGAKTLLIS